MSARVVSLIDWVAPQRDWSQRELAEFYRVEAALLQAGLKLETDRGVTDEGDPWFVFCRADDGEVFIHFARTRGEYVIAGPAYQGLSRGRDFAALIQDVISRHPLVQTPAGRKSNVFMHPAALLIAIVGTAFFKTSEAKAAEEGQARPEARRQLFAGAASGPTVLGTHSVALDAHQTLALVASAVTAIAWATEETRQGSARQAFLADPLAETLWVAEDRSAAPLVERAGAARSLAVHSAEPTSPQQAISQASASQVADILSLVSILAEISEPGRADDLEALARAAEPDAAAGARGSPAPLFIVDLKPGALPDVAAVRFLQDGRAGVDLSSAKVITVERLPQFLGELLQNGLQVQVGALEPAGPPRATETEISPTPPADEPDAPAQGDGGATGETEAPGAEAPMAPPPTSGQTPGQAPVDAAPPGPAPMAPPGVGPPPASDESSPPTDVAGPPAPPPPTEAEVSLPPELRDLFDDAELESAIATFLSLTPDYEVMVSNHEVVVYDVRLMQDVGLLRTAQSVTFHFADGSSISLVGTPAALDDAIDLLGLG